ncbi:MAG: Thermolysin metallopeptidase alpha-helical domain [Thermoleophilia bacterium]|nr:Thermolysin metallopeptidase alpha-helical domain [Thermoleophilia bacterium]
MWRIHTIAGDGRIIMGLEHHPGVGRGVELARGLYTQLDPQGRDELATARVRVHGGDSSWFNRITGTAQIGVGGKDSRGPQGALVQAETTIHELSHKWFDKRAGFGGLLYGGSSGRLSEGLAQTMAGTALILGGTPEEARYGWKVLDPRGQSAPMAGAFGGEGRRIPLSTTMDDIAKAGFTMTDNGLVHVHSGIVQAAHLDIARAIGAADMARITVDAANAGLQPTTGITRWAGLTLTSAERMFGAGSEAHGAVRAAWTAAKVALPG